MSRIYILLVVYAAVLLGLVLGYRILEEREQSSTPTAEKVLKVYGQPVTDQEVSYNGEFFIDFPAAPTYLHRQELLPEGREYLHWHSYSYQTSKTALYIVLVSEYPDDYPLSPAQDRLEAELRKVLQAEGIEAPKSKELSKWNGYPSLDFVIDDGSLRQEGRLIVVNNRTYRLIVVYPMSARGDVDFKGFIESFRIVQ